MNSEEKGIMCDVRDMAYSQTKGTSAYRLEHHNNNIITTRVTHLTGHTNYNIENKNTPKFVCSVKSYGHTAITCT